MNKEILLGNEAIGLALLEQGCKIITSYPGTPSSEILATVIKHKNKFDTKIYAEWSINEKVAFEIALAGSWMGLSTAVAMKQAGLNVASDALFNAAYTGTKGGFLVISADDPGPTSSQTEQDSRLTALAAKVPVFDPSSPMEARRMVGEALRLSKRYHLPVMLRPITRLSHAIQGFSKVDQNLVLEVAQEEVKFTKEPQRWTATPKLRHVLHIELNEKLAKIEVEFTHSKYNLIINEEISAEIGIIACGVVFNTVQQVLFDLNIKIPILKIGTVFPLPLKLIHEFTKKYSTLLVLEEPDVCVELQLPDRRKIHGRLDGMVPRSGELTPEIVRLVLSKIIKDYDFNEKITTEQEELKALLKTLSLPSRAPSLCPGCSHRSAFFILRQEFGKEAIYPGDIGCNSLGANLKAVDTFLDMGASISMAAGFYYANRSAGVASSMPIIATIGDSTFLHAGIPPLIDAVHNDARFVLVILDNHVVAMTGFQPTSGQGILADGSCTARKVSINALVQACGVGFVAEVDPYDQDQFRKIIREAYNHSQTPEGSLAVVIANHACVLKNPKAIHKNMVTN